MGCRALSVFLMRMGCSGGLALAIAVILRAISTAEAEMMMAPSGSHSGAASSIGSVPQDDVWTSLEQPASEGTHCPPLSSRASTPSSSFFRGLSDAAPAPELGEEVQQGGPTHSISQPDRNDGPSGSGTEASPSSAVEDKLVSFLSSFGKRAPQQKILDTTLEELKLQTTEGSDRSKILEIITSLQKEEFCSPKEAASQLILDYSKYYELKYGKSLFLK